MQKRAQLDERAARIPLRRLRAQHAQLWLPGCELVAPTQSLSYETNLASQRGNEPQCSQDGHAVEGTRGSPCSQMRFKASSSVLAAATAASLLAPAVGPAAVHTSSWQLAVGDGNASA